MSSEHLLEIQGLRTHFRTERGKVTAVDDVSFYVDRGEVLAVVGESGCGKSVTAHSILRLYDENGLVEYEGDVLFEGRNLLKLPMASMRSIRGNEISMIFQDPLSSLNPVFTIGDQIMEPLMQHQKLSKNEAYEKAIELLRVTNIPSPEKRVDEYPHQISGGMRQRVMIAIALACEPKLLIADEPTTALDVTVQAQILDLIDELKSRNDMGVIMITHDLGIVAQHCSRVVVMYLGEVVEEADVRDLFRRPLHPYTQGLLKAIPHLDGERSEHLHIIEGTVPALHEVPQGCRFSTRCPYANEQCMSQRPPLTVDEGNHKVKCWHYKDILRQERGR